jgi:hypothetical protein
MSDKAAVWTNNPGGRFLMRVGQFFAFSYDNLNKNSFPALPVIISGQSSDAR